MILYMFLFELTSEKQGIFRRHLFLMRNSLGLIGKWPSPNRDSGHGNLEKERGVYKTWYKGTSEYQNTIFDGRLISP